MKTPPDNALWPLFVTTALLFVAAGTVLAQNAVGQQNAPSIRNSVSGLYATDLDANGAPDLLVASPQNSEVAWYQNGEVKGNFSNRAVISTKVRLTKAVYAADIDQDGDADAVSSSSLDNKVAWYSNTDGYGTFGTQKIMTEKGGSPYGVYANDLTGNGAPDVLFASNENGTIAWCRNEGSSFSGKNVISSNVAGARSVHAADLDSDGDMDALSASSSFGGTNKIAWYRKTVDGFASQNIISQKVKGARSVVGADIDGDGDADVLSASAGDGKIAWYENTDGYGTFSSQKVITNQMPGAQTVSAADFDGDGDLDILAASNRKGKIAWFENVDGKSTFSSAKVITQKGNYKAAYVADFDVDGDPDVAYISESESQVGWCSNEMEQGEGWSAPQIVGP
jgi:hypothetical protein